MPPVRDDTASQASLRLELRPRPGRLRRGEADRRLRRATSRPRPRRRPAGRDARRDRRHARRLPRHGRRRRADAAHLARHRATTSSPTRPTRSRATSQAGTGATADSLITPENVSPLDPASWTATQLSTQLLGSRHDLIFLAGHFSANSALAADFSTSLLTTDLRGSSRRPPNSIVFSAGCHSGLQHRRRRRRSRPDGAARLGAGVRREGRDARRRHGLPVRRHRLPRVQRAALPRSSPQLRYGTGPVAVGRALALAKHAYLAAGPRLTRARREGAARGDALRAADAEVDLPAGRLTPPTDPPTVSPTASRQRPVPSLGLSRCDITLTPSLTLPHGDADRRRRRRERHGDVPLRPRRHRGQPARARAAARRR